MKFKGHLKVKLAGKSEMRTDVRRVPGSTIISSLVPMLVSFSVTCIYTRPLPHIRHLERICSARVALKFVMAVSGNQANG